MVGLGDRERSGDGDNDREPLDNGGDNDRERPAMQQQRANKVRKLNNGLSATSYERLSWAKRFAFDCYNACATCLLK